MMVNKLVFLILIFIFASVFLEIVESRAVSDNFHSDAIVTHWPSAATDEKPTTEEQQPGWMRQQLVKFGKMASRVGNAMGAHATKISAAVDKVCEVVKTVIPLLAAVCHVGQFKFCAATGGDEITQALSPNSLDLNIPD